MLRIEIHLTNPPAGMPLEIRSQNRVCGKTNNEIINNFNKIIAGIHIKSWRDSGELHSEAGERWDIERIKTVGDRPIVKYYRYDDFSAECVGELRVFEVRDNDIWEMLFGEPLSRVAGDGN